MKNLSVKISSTFWLFFFGAILLRFTNLYIHYYLPDPFGHPIVSRMDRFLPFATVAEIGGISLLLFLGFGIASLCKENFKRIVVNIVLYITAFYLAYGALDLEIMRYTKQHINLAFFKLFFSINTLKDPIVVETMRSNLASTIWTCIFIILPFVLAVIFSFNKNITKKQNNYGLIIILCIGIIGVSSPWWLNPTRSRRLKITPPIILFVLEIKNYSQEIWLAPDPSEGLSLLRKYIGNFESDTLLNAEYPLIRKAVCPNCTNEKKTINTKIVLIVGETYKGIIFNRILKHREFAPNFHSLTELGGGKWFKNAYSNGFPSVFGASSIYLGILNHPSKLISQEYIMNRYKGFPEYLKPSLNWMVNGADPYFDNQTALLSKYYSRIEFQDGNIKEVIAKGDEYVFGTATKMLPELPDTGSWMLTLNTVSTHYPYQVDSNYKENFELIPKSKLEYDYHRALAYSDAQFGKFLTELKKRKDFEDITIIIIGDHSNAVLPEELEYTPYFGPEKNRIFFGIFGLNTEKLGKFEVSEDIVSQIDLAPTILSLKKSRDLNHFMGRNLLATYIKPQPALFFANNSFAIHSNEGNWLGSLDQNQVIGFQPDSLKTISIEKSEADSILHWVNQMSIGWKYLLNNNKIWNE